MIIWERELIAVYVSSPNDCHYCRSSQLPPEKWAQPVWRTAIFDPAKCFAGVRRVCWLGSGVGAEGSIADGSSERFPINESEDA